MDKNKQILYEILEKHKHLQETYKTMFDVELGKIKDEIEHFISEFKQKYKKIPKVNFQGLFITLIVLGFFLPPFSAILAGMSLGMAMGLSFLGLISSVFIGIGIGLYLDSIDKSFCQSLSSEFLDLHNLLVYRIMPLLDNMQYSVCTSILIDKCLLGILKYKEELMTGLEKYISTGDPHVLKSIFIDKLGREIGFCNWFCSPKCIRIHKDIQSSSNESEEFYEECKRNISKFPSFINEKSEELLGRVKNIMKNIEEVMEEEKLYSWYYISREFPLGTIKKGYVLEPLSPIMFVTEFWKALYYDDIEKLEKLIKLLKKKLRESDFNELFQVELSLPEDSESSYLSHKGSSTKIFRSNIYSKLVEFHYFLGNIILEEHARAKEVRIKPEDTSVNTITDLSEEENIKTIEAEKKTKSSSKSREKLLLRDSGIMISIGRKYRVEIRLYDDHLEIEKKMKLLGGGGGLIGIAARAAIRASKKGTETITLRYTDVVASIRKSGKGPFTKKVLELSFKHPKTRKIVKMTILNLSHLSEIEDIISKKKKLQS